MDTEDFSIFEYRKQKQIINVNFVLKERLEGKFEKITLRTDTAGYIDADIYRPRNKNTSEIPLHVVFNFHGGGNVLGFYEMDGPYCQLLADKTNCAVVNVDYPLSPEFKFPTPIYSLYEFLVSFKKIGYLYNIDTTEFVLCGHSAGGYLAMAISIVNKKQLQLNISGIISDYSPLNQDPSFIRSYLDKDNQHLVSRMLQYVKWYTKGPEDYDNPLFNLTLANLKNLPKALIIGAEYDLLLKGEKIFVNKSIESGNDICFRIFEGVNHGFTHKNLKEFDPVQSVNAWNLMASFIKGLGYEREKNIR